MFGPLSLTHEQEGSIDFYDFVMDDDYVPLQPS